MALWTLIPKCSDCGESWKSSLGRRFFRSLRGCSCCWLSCCCFFFQAEDGIRDLTVTGVQTCALPISLSLALASALVSSLDDLYRHDHCRYHCVYHSSAFSNYADGRTAQRSSRISC